MIITSFHHNESQEGINSGIVGILNKLIVGIIVCKEFVGIYLPSDEGVVSVSYHLGCVVDLKVELCVAYLSCFEGLA